MKALRKGKLKMSLGVTTFISMKITKMKKPVLRMKGI